MVISIPTLHVCGNNSGCCVDSLNMLVLEYERKPNDQWINVVKSTEPMGMLNYKHEHFTFLPVSFPKDKKQ